MSPAKSKPPAKAPPSKKQPQSAFTQAIADQLCELIANGSTLRAAAQSVGFSRTTILQWMIKHEEFGQAMVRARVWLADYLEEDMASIEALVLQGKIDPQAARVALTSKQWRASKINPRKYGEHLDVDANVVVRIPQLLPSDAKL
jgi:hypothetical protein